MPNGTVLISGASIAGTSLAYWLNRYGYTVTVVERAPALRPGGQAVDFKGATHRRVLEQMGVLEDVEQWQTGKTDLHVVDEHDQTQAVIPGEFVGGDVEILRGDLGQILYRKTADLCEYRFGDTVTTLTQTDSGVEVEFEKADPQTFDIVLGADGIHSRTRRLVFGPEEQFVKYLGYYYAVAGATAGTDGTAPAQERAIGKMYNTPGRLAVLGGSKAPELFVFASEKLDDRRSDVQAQKEILRRLYAGAAWHVPEMLDRLDDVDDFYFDSISRVHMDAYTQGRIALVGDSAYGNTLGGFGTGLAMVGAYVLAGELALAHGDHRQAFAKYDESMLRYSKVARKTNAGPFMAPPSRFRIKMRNWNFTNRLAFKMMMKLTDMFANDIDLRDYPVEIDDASGRDSTTQHAS